MENMFKTMYRVGKAAVIIEPVLVSKITDKCIILQNNKRELKETQWHKYFSLFYEAKIYAIDLVESYIAKENERHKGMIKHLEAELLAAKTKTI